MFEQYITNDYLRFVIIFVVGFIVLRIAIHFIEKIIVSFTVKTKTDLDDLIIKKTSKPISFLILMIVLKISLNELVFAGQIGDIINKIVVSLIWVAVFVMVYAIFFLIFEKSWKRLNKKNKSKGKNEGLFHLFQGFLKIVFVLVVLLIVLDYWNVALGPLLAGIGIGGVALAFALQSSLGNIFGGISIILDDSVRVGDLVNLSEGVSGKIVKVGLRSTKIKTFDNEIIIVPNGKLADSNIHNLAKPEPKSRVVIPFGVSYGSNIETVKKIVTKEIKKITGFVENPGPSVRFLEMGDSSLNFKAYFFVDTFENRFNAIDEANTFIYNALNKANIEIPFPQMDVNVKKK